MNTSEITPKEEWNDRDQKNPKIIFISLITVMGQKEVKNIQ